MLKQTERVYSQCLLFGFGARKEKSGRNSGNRMHKCVVENIEFYLETRHVTIFAAGKAPAGMGTQSHHIFDTQRSLRGSLFWCQISLVGWLSDSESGGTGFDSRLGRDMFGSLFGNVGAIFSHFLDMLGDVWGYFGDVFGWVWDGFEKKFRRGRKHKIFKCVWEYFPVSGRSKQLFLADPWTKIPYNLKKYVPPVL